MKNFQRVIFFSVHGGYSVQAIQEVIDEFENAHPDKKGNSYVHRFNHIIQPETEENRRDTHAGWVETSLMMYLFPDMVGKEIPPADFHESGVLSASGIDGDPSQASLEKGKDLFEKIVADTIEWLKS